MKKLLAVLILFAMLLPLLAGCNSHPIEQKTLSDELKTKIRNKIIVNYDEYLNWDAAEEISQPYYGSINGCVIVQVTKDIRWWIHRWEPKLEIAGYLFETPDPITIYAYRNEEVCLLQEAYERGWLTKADLGNIHKRHNQIYAQWIKEKRLYQSLFLLDGNTYERIISSSESRENAVELCTQEFSGISTIVSKCELVYESDLLYGLYVTWEYWKHGKINTVYEEYVISFKKSIAEADAIPIRINTRDETQIEKVLLYLYLDKYHWHMVRNYQMQTTDKEYIMTLRVHYIQSHDWNPATHEFLVQTILVDRTTGEVTFDCEPWN